MPRHNRIDYPIPQIREWISQGKTQQWIAEHLQRTLDPRVTAKLIYKVCKKHCIKCQRGGPRSGPGHPEWKGGEVVAKSGYVKVYQPNHPSCVAANKKRKQKANGKYFRKKVYVWKHRLVAEKTLGRFLKPHEVVHHKDGDIQNNSPENLEVFETNAAHLSATLVGKCPKWTYAGKARLRHSAQLRAAKSHLNPGRHAKAKRENLPHLPKIHEKLAELPLPKVEQLLS